jgi:formate hydrogenlyase subunit 4
MTRLVVGFLFLAFSLALAPLLPGVINRVKAKVAGRQGRPLLQLYYDLIKLMRKSPVYPYGGTWIFRAAPAAGVAAGILALALLPLGSLQPLISFPGDFLLLAGVFGLARFTFILAALDTGSAFEGMGAAREALISALAEPILLFSLLILGFKAQDWSLGGMLGGASPELWRVDWPFYVMLSCAFFLLLLPENCRIPVDDPNTHLELTMIHEVMLLDHSGPDLAFLEYASALKLWTFCLLAADVLLPALAGGLLASNALPAPLLTAAGVLLTLAFVFLAAVLVGIVESVMARLRMERIPQALTLAGSFACLAALSLWSK